MLSALLSLFIVGCRSTGNTQSIGSDLQASPGKVYCGVPQESDFSRSGSNEESDSLLSKLQKSDVFSRVKGALSIPPTQEVSWLVKAVAPLSMGCGSFSKNGILTYGSDSYINFTNILQSIYLPPTAGGLIELKAKFNSTVFSGDASLYPIVDILRAINAKVANNPSGKVRRAGEEVLDSNPLSEEEVIRLREITEEGILSMSHYDIPWKNAYGQMVTGDFLVYAKGDQVSKFLVKLNDDFLADSKINDEQVYIDASARLVRRCLAIHPFHDGNGRSCTLLGVWALARRGIPHSVAWAGEDVLLRELDWRQKFRDGVQYHRSIIAGKN